MVPLASRTTGLVGVELAEAAGVPARAQEHRAGLAGQPGVGPAGQVDDQERVVERRALAELEQLAHEASVAGSGP
jgi:hypothetical protein